VVAIMADQEQRKMTQTFNPILIVDSHKIGLK
jgi:hypothetical protein